MNSTTDIRADMENRAGKAFARSRAYSLLAQGFRYPESASFDLIRTGAYGEALYEAVGDAWPQLTQEFKERDLPRLVFAGNILQLEAGYLAAFENNLPKPSLSLYEGSYGEHRGDKSGLLLELKGFYRNFGLSMADNDMEDSLVAELEFMQFLAAKQAMSERGALDRAPYLRAQRDFLQRHLATWLPALLAEAGAILQEPFYLALIEAAAAFAAADCSDTARDLESLGL